MAKTILKESTIIILLIVSIGLLLTIVFYDYVPNSKVVPANVVAYKIEDDVQEEISNTTENSMQNIIKTYIIDETDLSGYEKTESYDKGKENPFAISKEYTSSIAIPSDGVVSNTVFSNTVGNTTNNNTSNTKNEMPSSK